MSSLFLFPADPFYLPENNRMLITVLQDLEFAGETLASTARPAFFIGERFFQLISFMGCAPSLNVEPASPGDEQFCHIRLHHNTTPVFHYLRPERPARCPVCRQPGLRADEFARQQADTGTHWHCPACDTAIKVQQLDWRREAGLGQLLLEVRDVYPHEGVPTDFLLQQLKTATDQTWSYFYAN